VVGVGFGLFLKWIVPSNLHSIKGLFGIAFEWPKNVFNTQEVHLKKKVLI
jgi:hypothetical protein